MRGELNYTTTEKELLAIVYALQRFRSTKFGSPVKIRSDHAALQFIKQIKVTEWKANSLAFVPPAI